MTEFKRGAAWLAEQNPDAPVIPVFLHGLGKALPKGEAVFVTFFCDVFVGKPLHWSGDRKGFISELKATMDNLVAEGDFSPWE